ncbi:LOW QUALITY PROTEIN: hypothetical protein BC937DRAFT_90500 [Endogone sp. FLAS-F59071]|nr:LOW QUALITY PROTEIN: hypothetical protein BC937DRAFT_90500 [Endogone sp. FLAS-F59071]|eukprot:RUS17047.1 LOW QUALITY PROTEIN: hypothetical protein BC937DRAFT_90500 [Endogone sp. FLAS-F59071]
MLLQSSGAEITTELDKIHVHIIPYNSLAFTKKNFRRGGFADIHLGSLENRRVAVKAQLKQAGDIIQEVRILSMVANHRNIVEFLGITR